MKIPYMDLKKTTLNYQPAISEAIQRVLDSGWYILGEEGKAFEKEFATYCGCRHCIGTGNGLDALTVLLTACRILYHWDEMTQVIVPAHTFIATVESIVRSGLTPILCDVDADDSLIDPQQVESCISPRTRAIVCVHLYGKIAPITSLNTIAQKNGLLLLEDAAQAHGAIHPSGNKAGHLGHGAAFSFYPTKNLGALGDGGAITTDNQSLADLCRQLANYGQTEKYHHLHKGMNTRLDEIQAAILRTRLKSLDKENTHRQSIARQYMDCISHPDIRMPYKGVFPQDSVWHIFPIYSPRRNELQKYLAHHNIDTLIHYPVPPHLQPAFQEYSHLSFPCTEQICQEELSLPLNPLMTNQETDYIIQTINRFPC